MALVLVGTACSVVLPKNLEPREYPNLGWWDVVLVIVIFALIAAAAYLAVRNDNEKG